MKKIGPWTRLTTTKVYDNPWISVEHQEVLNPNGNPGIYGVVKFKNTAIGIIALDQELNTWIVGQYRYPLEQYSWEIPEGGGPLNEEPVESAKRELKEECGIEALVWEPIIDMHLSNSVSNEFGIVYLARELSFGESQPEDTEQLVVKKLPFKELFDLVMTGEITDSLSVAGVLKAYILLKKTGEISW